MTSDTRASHLNRLQRFGVLGAVLISALSLLGGAWWLPLFIVFLGLCGVVVACGLVRALYFGVRWAWTGKSMCND